MIFWFLVISKALHQKVMEQETVSQDVSITAEHPHFELIKNFQENILTKGKSIKIKDLLEWARSYCLYEVGLESVLR